MASLQGRVRIDILASGSRGNAALLRSPQSALLIDAGLSHKELGRRLQLVGSSFDEIGAVLVSHAHTDHVRALKLMSRRADLQLLASRACLDELPLSTRARCKLCELHAGQPLRLDDFNILPVATSHDAAGSLAFRIEIADKLRLGWATDLGVFDDRLLSALSHCDILGVESNHDSELLQTGPYPWFLKQRVASNRGHLSNDQSASLLGALLHEHLREVVALHLSAKNNRPELACASLQAVVDAAGHPLLVRAAAQDDILSLPDCSLSRGANPVKKRSNNSLHGRPIL